MKRISDANKFSTVFAMLSREIEFATIMIWPSVHGAD